MELRVIRRSVTDEGVATVELHRPERHNSWTARMHAEYRWVMADLEADPRVRVVVLTGSGSTFCVGADSKALDTYVNSPAVGKDGFDPGVGTEAAQPGYGVRPEFDADVTWQLGLRFPLICAVNGSCAGVAMAMAAYSDLRFAVSGAKVTTATPALAMPAEYGLSWILPRLVGVTHAADILLSGRILRSEELRDMGFFNRVFSADEFAAGVDDYARMLAKLSPEALRTTKRQLWGDVLDASPAASVEESKRQIGRLMREPDYAEGVAALKEKRAPQFGKGAQ